MKNWKLAVAAGILLIVGGLRPAQAELTAQLNLEEKIENRVTRIVSGYDAFANIRVSVSFKKLSAPLPGTAIDLTNFSGSESAGVEMNDISSVKVTISSSKFPVPEWVKESVNSELAFLGGRKSVDFQPMSDAMKKDLEGNISNKEKISLIAEGLFRKYSSFAEGLMTSITMKLMVGLVTIMCIFLAGLTGISLWLNKKRDVQIANLFDTKLLPALQNMGAMGNSGGGAKNTTTVKIEGNGPQGALGGAKSNDHSDVEGLTPQALVAIFSDCYWCRSDAYASWMWSVMTPAQRLSLYQNEFVDPDYLKFIQSMRKEAREDHLDPVYLEPLAIHNLSQEDLAKWVKTNPSAWQALSPIRQATLPLTLQERLKCISEPVKTRAQMVAMPTTKSTKRTLATVKRFGELSFDDEMAILQSPSMIPETLKSSMRSLVWLALKPLEERQKALADWSAEELASAWVAAPAVLAKLSEALPEKKKQMLTSYLATTRAGRDSDVFKGLVEEGLRTAVATLKVAA